MKNRDFEFSKTRKQLQKYKNQGEKEVTWKLSSKQIQIIKLMDLRFEPWLYEIKTRPLYNIRSIKSPLLKEIHYKNKQGHNMYVRRLNHDEQQLLKDFGIKFRVVKYKIYLYQ